MSLGLLIVGLTWAVVRFGLSDAGLADRADDHVRRVVLAQAGAVRGLSARVADEGPLITEAAGARDRLPALFERLRVLAAGDGRRPVAVTVYVPGAGPADYRVLAWSDGPGEQNLTVDRLAGPSAVFVAPGYAGLRLVAVDPVQVDGTTVAVAVAETVLAPADRRIQTPYGAIPIAEHDDAAVAASDTAGGRTVVSALGTPLVDVRHHLADLTAYRRLALMRVLALALVPLLAGVSIGLARWHDRRPPPTGVRGRWGRQTALGVGAVAVAAGAAGLAWMAGLPLPVRACLLAAGLLVGVTQMPAALWWHAARRRAVGLPAWQFVVEHLAGGFLLALGLEGVARLLRLWVTLAVLDRGPFVLFPVAPLQTLSAGTLLLLETAMAWSVAAVLAALAIRWRLLPVNRRTIAAAACWIAPVIALPLVPASVADFAGPTLPAIAVVALVSALALAAFHRMYRHATQSVRLASTLLAGLVPLATLYPLAAQTVTRATREVIETRYAPATAGHRRELWAELGRAQVRVDALPSLVQLVSAPSAGDSRAANYVWNQIGLQRSRVVSDVELYGPDRALVSRFAFNLPEYRATLQPWEGSNCTWEVFGHVIPVGAEERQMLRAERAVCDDEGRLLGGIVLHMAGKDYQALPFVSSPSPYAEVLGLDSQQPRLRDVRLAVYGWSGQPFFSSERAAWAVPPETFDRLYRTGEAFWLPLASDDRWYDVHFSQDREGIYALGVPRVTLVEHATRLAEIAVLAVAFFVLWQVGLVLHAMLARRPHAPLRRLFEEVRTSFYRKLFISFVAVAVVPVLAAAVAFGGYMTAQFRADVEYEASTTVTVASRVFQELAVPADRTTGERLVPNDDLMVWIRLVTGHDVNLFEGSELEFTSQRDLFDAGFLPTRTPAAVYRAVALERRPSFVVEDTVGASRYIVAAAPVATWGRDAVLTVPLAPRQREMERELDTLNRRVLVGAVFVVLFAAGVGASLAGRISDPVARLSRATRQIAAGNLDVRVTTDTADELRRLVDDFNRMAGTLGEQRAELARANQLKAWNEMARQVAHEIKNPLTPVQLAAEHLQHVHDDRDRPLGRILDQCVGTILTQVRLLRQIASEFANFAGEPVSRPTTIGLAALLQEIVEPYRVGIGTRVTFDLAFPADLPPVLADRTLLARALTNLVENAVQAMPGGGTLTITGRQDDGRVELRLTDTGVGMDETAAAHAFEPYFSTKTGGSGLGLANAKRNIEREGGTVTIASAPGEGTTVTVTLRAAAEPPAPTGDSV